MCRGVQSIVSAGAGWRQIRSKTEGDKQIFKIDEVKAWVVKDDGVASPLSFDGEIDSDFKLVEVITPLCDDSEEELLRRIHSRTLH